MTTHRAAVTALLSRVNVRVLSVDEADGVVTVSVARMTRPNPASVLAALHKQQKAAGTGYGIRYSSDGYSDTETLVFRP